MKDFFAILRGKTEREPSKDFDKRFWGSFEEEFGEKRRRWPFLVLQPRFMIPIGASLLLVLFIWNRGPINPEVGEMLAYAPMLKDMELYIDEEGEGVDYSALTDEEWGVLLKGT